VASLNPIAQLGAMRFLLIAAICNYGLGRVPTVEIAKGVFMPMINHGNGNQTLWVELGGYGMDTALEYGDANQQRIKTAVAAKLVDRSKLFVTTKVPCCPSDVYSYSTRVCKDWKDWHSTTAQIDLTLQKIGIGQVDLLLMHYPCNDWEGTLAAYKEMEAALAHGKVRAIGVSNFNASLLEALTKESKVKPAVTQNPYSVGNHRNALIGSDDATLKYCHKNGITLSAWGPLGGTTGHSTDIFHSSIVKSIADAHSRSAAQVALRWDVQQGILPVTAGDNPAHMLENMNVFDFELTEDEMRRLAAIGSGSGHDSGGVFV